MPRDGVIDDFLKHLRSFCPHGFSEEEQSTGIVVTVPLATLSSRLRNLRIVVSVEEEGHTVPVKSFQGPGTSGHPEDCSCAACRNFDD